jgi:hypothetical protein
MPSAPQRKRIPVYIVTASPRREAKATVLALLLAGFASACGQTAGSPPPAPSVVVATTAPAAFPLHVEPGTRHLVDARGKPFMLWGDNPSSLLVMLSPGEVAQYLDDRKARGFNTLLFELIEHKFATRPPYNRNGDAPFTGSIPDANGSHCMNAAIKGCWDFSRPNEAYWAHVDAVIPAATDRGFLLLVFPAYVGYGGRDEGWYQDMLANGTTTLTAYGKYVATRYQRRDNLIWVQGGDYIPENPAGVHAVAEGIRSVLPNALQTAHTSRRHAASDVWADAPWLSIDNIYTGYSAHDAARNRYATSTKPFFLIEAVYENPTPLFPDSQYATASQVRSQAYQAVLGGAFGQIMGNNPVWYFGKGWQRALDSPGAQSMSHMHNLMNRYSWWLLEPDAARLVVSGQSSDAEFAPAASASDRSFTLAYLPTSRRIDIDLARLAGPQVQAQWFDPSNGTVTSITESPLASSGVHAFTPPRKNAAGDRDWVLVLESKR